jgi:hypothetical protein
VWPGSTRHGATKQATRSTPKTSIRVLSVSAHGSIGSTSGAPTPRPGRAGASDGPARSAGGRIPAAVPRIPVAVPRIPVAVLRIPAAVLRIRAAVLRIRAAVLRSRRRSAISLLRSTHAGRRSAEATGGRSAVTLRRSTHAGGRSTVSGRRSPHAGRRSAESAIPTGRAGPERIVRQGLRLIEGADRGGALEAGLPRALPAGRTMSLAIPGYPITVLASGGEADPAGEPTGRLLRPAIHAVGQPYPANHCDTGRIASLDGSRGSSDYTSVPKSVQSSHRSSRGFAVPSVT